MKGRILAQIMWTKEWMFHSRNESFPVLLQFHCSEFYYIQLFIRIVGSLLKYSQELTRYLSDNDNSTEL